MELTEVERALDALEARGARLFDAPSCACVRSLIAKAEELGGEAGRLLGERASWHLERLRARFAARPIEAGRLLGERASWHLERLRARFDRARSEAREQLAALEGARGVRQELRDLLEIGDLVRLRRRMRKLRHAPLGTTLARGEAQRKRASEYEESLAELVASLALARAVDVVPEHAGPYNPLRIASELLGRMRAVSPLYLTVQLNRLEELASLLSLPTLPVPPSSGSGRKRRSLKG